MLSHWWIVGALVVILVFVIGVLVVSANPSILRYITCSTVPTPPPTPATPSKRSEDQKENEEVRERSLVAIEEKREEIMQRREVEKAIVEVQPPEIERLKKLLNDLRSGLAAEPPTGWDSLLAIADIYRKGAYPRFLPDEDSALECYKTAAMCPDGDVAGMAQARYIETRTEAITSEDRAGKALPRDYAREACRVAEAAIMIIPYSSFGRPRAVKPKVRATPAQSQRQQPPPREDIMAFGEELGGGLMDFLEAQFATPNTHEPIDINQLDPAQATAPAYASDSQNVHDHSVVRTMKKNIDRLYEDTKGSLPTDTSRAKEQVRNAILEQAGLSETEKYNALEVLDNLTSSTHSAYGRSEADVLKMVWSKIGATSDPGQRDNLKEMLGRQLASGIENGLVVCSTGKIGRLMGTFDGVVSPEESGMEASRPMWAVKEELANLAAKVREEHEARGSTDDAAMRRDYEDRATQEYVGKLGMSKRVIEPIVQMYSEGF